MNYWKMNKRGCKAPFTECQKSRQSSKHRVLTGWLLPVSVRYVITKTLHTDISIFGKMLAAQGVLTYCATRPLPYHLYADECELLVLTALLTSARLSKISFLTACKRGCKAPFIL